MCNEFKKNIKDSILNTQGGEEIPAGGWRGGEEIPVGGWRGGEEIPAGGWRSPMGLYFSTLTKINKAKSIKFIDNNRYLLVDDEKYKVVSNGDSIIVKDTKELNVKVSLPEHILKLKEAIKVS